MRVLHVASYYAPRIGGMETVLQDLSEGLVRLGQNVTVLCASNGPRGTSELRGGVSVVRSPRLAVCFSQPIAPLLGSQVRKLGQSADIVHLHMPNPLAELAVLSLAPGVPVVVTYHSDIIRQRILRPLYGPVRQAVLERARRIVVPTPNHVRFSEVLPSFEHKCDVVPFGISVERYRLNERVKQRAADLRRSLGA